MVRPEVHEPLAKRRVGDGRDLVAGAGVLHEVVAEDRTVGALRSLGGFGVAGLARHAHLALLVLHVAQDLGRARERGELRRRVGGAQLVDVLPVRRPASPARAPSPNRFAAMTACSRTMSRPLFLRRPEPRFYG